MRWTGAILLTVVAGSVGAQQPELRVPPPVKVEHAERDFGAIETYAWLPSPDHAENLAHHIRISQAVEKTLPTRGLRQEPGSQPDVYVRYRLTTAKKIRSSSYTLDSAWGSNSTRTMVDFKRVPTGTLIIDMFDGGTRDRIWEGTLEYDVARADLVLDQLDEVVERILAEFPPKPPAEPSEEPEP